jgi:hypothetical protein
MHYGMTFFSKSPHLGKSGLRRNGPENAAFSVTGRFRLV